MNTVVIAVREANGSFRKIAPREWEMRTPSIEEVTVVGEDEFRQTYEWLHARLDETTQHLVLMGMGGSREPVVRLASFDLGVIWLRANHNQVSQSQ